MDDAVVGVIKQVGARCCSVGMEWMQMATKFLVKTPPDPLSPAYRNRHARRSSDVPQSSKRRSMHAPRRPTSAIRASSPHKHPPTNTMPDTLCTPSSVHTHRRATGGTVETVVAGWCPRCSTQPSSAPPLRDYADARRACPPTSV